jgi:hypothetical protein
MRHDNTIDEGAVSQKAALIVLFDDALLSQYQQRVETLLHLCRIQDSRTSDLQWLLIQQRYRVCLHTYPEHGYKAWALLLSALTGKRAGGHDGCRHRRQHLQCCSLVASSRCSDGSATCIVHMLTSVKWHVRSAIITALAAPYAYHISFETYVIKPDRSVILNWRDRRAMEMFRPMGQ